MTRKDLWDKMIQHRDNLVKQHDDTIALLQSEEYYEETLKICFTSASGMPLASIKYIVKTRIDDEIYRLKLSRNNILKVFKKSSFDILKAIPNITNDENILLDAKVLRAFDKKGADYALLVKLGMTDEKN